MYKTKSFWIILVLSVALLGAAGVAGLSLYYVKEMNIVYNIDHITNIRFQSFRYRELSQYLEDGDIDRASKKLKFLAELNTSTLNMMQDPEKYPATVNRAARITLERIASGQEHGRLKPKQAAETQ